MFKNQGKSRTLKHNIEIAVILSFIAGFVNVIGFLSFKQMTSNVTGHFTHLIMGVFNLELSKGMIYFLFVFSFLFGSFLSSLIIENYKENKKLNIYAIPILIECLILISIGALSIIIEMHSTNLILCLLLFAMGLQNSLVTKISDAVVRTTHLTGLFTDLGIELSHLFFPKSYPDKILLKNNIKLRIYIISFFFTGGVMGGILYYKVNLQLKALIIGGLILLASLFYDDFKYSLVKTKRIYNNLNSYNKKK